MVELLRVQDDLYGLVAVHGVVGGPAGLEDADVAGDVCLVQGGHVTLALLLRRTDGRAGHPRPENVDCFKVNTLSHILFQLHLRPD